MVNIKSKNKSITIKLSDEMSDANAKDIAANLQQHFASNAFDMILLNIPKPEPRRYIIIRLPIGTTQEQAISKSMSLAPWVEGAGSSLRYLDPHGNSAILTYDRIEPHEDDGEGRTRCLVED